MRGLAVAGLGYSLHLLCLEYFLIPVFVLITVVLLCLIFVFANVFVLPFIFSFYPPTDIKSIDGRKLFKHSDRLLY